MKTKSIVILLSIFSIVLAGCTPPLHPPTSLPNPAVTANLVAPGIGSVFPIAEYIDLSVAVYAQQSTISTLTFLANGSSIAEGVFSPPDYFFGRWLPPTDGEYYIQAQVTLMDGSTAISEAHRICVMPFGPGELPIGFGFMGSCQLPTRIPVDNRATSGDVVIHATVSPSVVQFVTTPGCPGSSPNVTFIVRVNDPQDMVVLVIGTLVNARATYVDPEYLNWITTRSGNQKEYRRTIQLVSYFFGGIIRWYVQAFGRDGRELGLSEGVINFELIECSQQRLEVQPSEPPQVYEILPNDTPTPRLVGPPTLTLTKNAFCRTGPDMTFPDVTAVPAGDTVDILNVSEDGFWYFIFWKKYNEKCWVAASTGDVTGEITGVQTLMGPDLPDSGPAPEPERAPEPELPPEPAPEPCNPLIRVCP